MSLSPERSPVLMKKQIDIAVGGRFHADFMAEALVKAGHDVRLFTTYPKFKFPTLDTNRIQNFLWPEIILRIAKGVGAESLGDRYKITTFGRRLASHLQSTHRRSDLFISWSSFGLEAMRLAHAKERILIRDSSHILFQSEILGEEYQRLGLRYQRRDFCIERELEEYGLADTIVVLSEFAKRTFVDRGVAPDKLKILRLGVNMEIFKPNLHFSPSLPVKVVFFGTLGVRKGVHTLLEATRDFSPTVLRLTLVGPVERDFKPILRRYSHAEVWPSMSHAKLSDFVRRMHVYACPTIEDGFSFALVQAMSCGLVPVVTPNCGAAEYIRDGENGFLVPVRDVSALTRVFHRLVENPLWIATLKNEAVKISSLCSWEKYGQEVRSLMDPSLAANPKYAMAR